MDRGTVLEGKQFGENGAPPPSSTWTVAAPVPSSWITVVVHVPPAGTSAPRWGRTYRSRNSGVRTRSARSTCSSIT
ncbi:hypothetical protein PJ267_02210 [Arthrobacter sp. OVS8]|nr:hypothetical protein PJ267_02210 [Arthrobacter sp. OVS8]